MVSPLSSHGHAVGCARYQNMSVHSYMYVELDTPSSCFTGLMCSWNVHMHILSTFEILVQECYNSVQAHPCYQELGVGTYTEMGTYSGAYELTKERPTAHHSTQWQCL